MYCFLTLKRIESYFFIDQKSNSPSISCQTYARIRKCVFRDFGFKYGCLILSVKIIGN